MPRKAHRPTTQSRKFIKLSSGLGAKQQELADLLGISIPTLTKHYAVEISQGIAKANLAVSNEIYRQITSKDKNVRTLNSTAIQRMFWMKTRAGWRETSVVEHNDPGGMPLKPSNVVVYLPDNGRGPQSITTRRGPKLIEIEGRAE